MVQFDTGQYINRNGDTMKGFLWLKGNPLEDLHAVPKQYVDAQIAANTPKLFCAYDSAGGTAIGTSWTDIPLDTEITKDSPFTHSILSNPAEITFNNTGVYLLNIDCSLSTTAGSTNSNTDVRLVLNGTEINGTRASCYTRESGAKDTASINIIQQFSASDVLKLQAQKSSGSNTVVTLAEGSRVVIQKINTTINTGSSLSGHAMGAGIFSYITYP